MFFCPICRKEYKTIGAVSNHLSRFHKRRLSLNENADLKYNLYKQKSTEKEIRLLCKKYRSGFSLPDLSNEYGLDFKTITFLIEYNGIKLRTISESKNQKKCKEKTKQTNLEKYGYEHNFNKNHPSRKKWEMRLLKEEGITNVFQRESVKQKIVKYWNDNYGVNNPMELEWYRKKIEKTNIKRYGIPHPILKYNRNGRQITKPHKIIMDYLDRVEIKYIPEEWIETKNNNYFVDILIDNKIIEIFGDYWHCNPIKYSKTDIVNFPYGKIKVKDIWDKDKKRIKEIEKRKYKVLVLWENEIIKNNFEEKLCEFLK